MVRERTLQVYWLIGASDDLGGVGTRTAHQRVHAYMDGVFWQAVADGRVVGNVQNYLKALRQALQYAELTPQQVGVAMRIAFNEVNRFGIRLNQMLNPPSGTNPSRVSQREALNWARRMFPDSGW